MGNVRVIEIKESVFADNDATSKAIREKMSAQGTLFLNVMSGPGSGKTTLLSALINRMKEQLRIGEMDVDIETSLDAQRVTDLTGVESIQISLNLKMVKIFCLHPKNALLPCCFWIFT